MLIEKLVKNKKPITITVTTTAILLFYYMPTIFGILFITTTLIFLIAIFNPKKIKETITKLSIFLLITGLIFAPILISLSIEKHKLNNPELIINTQKKEIQELTDEFKQKNINWNDTTSVISHLQNYVYSKYSYELGDLYIYPTTEDVLNGKNSDCRARAIIGYSILKKLGYNAYIACGITEGPHSWIKIYQNNTTIDIFKAAYNKPDFEPMVIFNEQESKWGSPLNQIYGYLFKGFYYPWFSIHFFASLLFIIPIIMIAFYILIFNKTKKILHYILTTIAIFLIVISLGIISQATETLIPIIFIITGGIFLRILNWKFPSKIICK